MHHRIQNREIYDADMVHGSIDYLNLPYEPYYSFERFIENYRCHYQSKLFPIHQLESFFHDRVQQSSKSPEVFLEEPFRVFYDLGKKEVFSKRTNYNNKRQYNAEIEYLKKGIEDLMDLPDKLRIKRRLRIYNKPTKKRHYRDIIYTLYRLQIAKKVKEELAIDFNISLSELFTLYLIEGDLNIPLSLVTYYLELEPNELMYRNKEGKIVRYLPYGYHFKNYSSPHLTFYVEKKELKFSQKSFQKEVKICLKDRAFILNNIAKVFTYKSREDLPFNWEVKPLPVLQNTKENAIQMNLLAYLGLDIYSLNIFPIEGLYERDRKRIFCYHYARFRIQGGSKREFDTLLDEAKQIYDQCTRIDEKQFKEGKLYTKSLVCTDYNIKDQDHNHHIIPLDPVDFVSIFVKEGLVTFQAFKTCQLIFGGNRFDIEVNNVQKEGLPPSVAYVRYNMGDIQFTLVLLDLLSKVVLNIKITHHSKIYLWNIKNKLREFRKDEYKSLWDIAEQTPDYLNNKDVRSGKTIRDAIARDARDGNKYEINSPGETEQNAIDELLIKGKLNLVVPLVNMMTTEDLWQDFQQYMLSPAVLVSNKWYTKYLKDYKERFNKYYNLFSKHI